MAQSCTSFPSKALHVLCKALNVASKMSQKRISFLRDAVQRLTIGSIGCQSQPIQSVRFEHLSRSGRWKMAVAEHPWGGASRLCFGERGGGPRWSAKFGQR